MSATTLDSAARLLYCLEPLRRPILQAIIAACHLSRGSWGLDVGCGIGLQAVQLAQAVGPQGHVIGLDASASHLEVARALVGQAGLADRVSFQQGRWDQIPCEDGSFDWVWSMDAAGYAPDGALTIIRELARVISPGGRLILGYWSSQCLLPGYPALEARLNASPAGIAPFQADGRPETHFLNTLGWLRTIGLADRRVETFVRTVSAPLDPDVRDALTQLLAMRWGTAEAGVSPEDWREYLRLCQAGSPDLVLNSPDYVAFFTHSVFSGAVPDRDRHGRKVAISAQCRGGHP
ncbi:MAG: class I SAM-dependent methyltransferase [Anaerolineae bacterium]|nr:class I SAM-dependent methyltransferase [Anaerolineae bacterium]